MTYDTDIERLNYYEGEFLGAVDFQAEQDYHRDMRRRHNLGQHTWGIVTGLDLAQAPNGGMDGSTPEVDVYLQPGMAVDGLGREIVVLSQAQLMTEMFAAFYNPNPGASPVWMYVWICYQEALLQPPADACANPNVSNAYGRIQETYTLTVTAANVPPTNSAIVVDGSQTTPPAEPSATSSSSSGSSGTPAQPDPPLITLPYDDSVPFQEFSTDDSSLVWWIALGRVMWDPYNEVFLQINSDPVQAAISAAAGREYVGNVSAITYAPAGVYTIVDRNSPYPPPADADPNLGGVKAEVAGSLQVDYLLNAEMNVLIGGAYNTNTTPPLSPLTIVASSGTATPQSPDQQLIQFLNPTQDETWYINQLFDGATPGLNFGEVTTAGKDVDNRIFIQPTQTSSTVPSPQNVGIGTSTPRNPLAIRGQGTWWELLSLEDNTGTTKWHLNHNPQGKDPRTGSTYTPGLNFCETQANANFRLFLQAGGNVGIGTGFPIASLDVASGPLHVGQTTNPTVTTQGTYLAWNMSGGTGETDFINNQGFGSGGFAFWNAPSSGTPLTPLATITGSGNMGIGATVPLQNLSVNAGLNIDQLNQNPGGPSFVNGPNKMLTFGAGAALGNGSGEGIGSCRVSGGANQYGLDFYTDWNVRMSIAQLGLVTILGDLTVNGTVNGTTVGHVADRFINRDGVKLERGDVLVLHKTPSSHFYGPEGRVPLSEVQLTDTALDPRVCGIVDEPALADSRISDLDRTKLGNVQVGLMVTLGAFAHCKVDADIAPISPGDLLTTSPTRGCAQKLDPSAPVRPGAIIGKALGALANGKGTIPILVSHL